MSVSKERKIAEAVEKQFGRGSCMVLGDDGTAEKVEVISTGSAALDLATGIGGYPKGRVVELYGPAGARQSLLALHAVVQEQKAGGVCALVDVDNAFDTAVASEAGVEIGRLLVSQPDSAEQALDIAETLARSGAVDLVVLDSVAGLKTKDEIAGNGIEDGQLARVFAQALRKLTAVAHRTGTCLLFANRLVSKPGFSRDGTSAGNGLKFYASMRIDVRSEGDDTLAKVAKNKFAPPFTEARFGWQGAKIVEKGGA